MKMIKTTINISIDNIRYSMAYAIVDVTVQTWAGSNESKVVIKEPLVVLREDLDRRITSDGDTEPLFLFIIGEIFQRSMFSIGYGAEVIEIRDMVQNSNKYLLYYEPGVRSMINVKVMRIPDLWYEQQAFVLMGMILATKAEGRSLFPNEKEDRGTSGVTIRKGKGRIKLYKPNSEEDRGTSGITIRKPISKKEWFEKLEFGWPEYELTKQYYVSESASKDREEENENGEKETRTKGYI